MLIKKEEKFFVQQDKETITFEEFLEAVIGEETYSLGYKVTQTNPDCFIVTFPSSNFPNVFSLRVISNETVCFEEIYDIDLAERISLVFQAYNISTQLNT